MSIVPHKTCTRCGQSKPIDQFIKGPRYADGYQPWCADCRRAYRKERTADPVKRKQDSDRTLAWIKSHPHAIEARKERDYRYWRDPEMRQKHQANEHKRMQNPEQRARKNKLARATHYRRFQSDPAYREQHHWRKKQETHRRREWKSGGKVSREEWRKLCEQFNHCCAACGKKTKLTMDHVIPLSKGGSHSIDNLQPLCITCNQKKHDKTIDYR